MPFVSRVPVRFGDVDFARIAYYPRILHLLHVAFEEMFEQHVGVSYATLVAERHVGFPTVHLDCDFNVPLRYGDVLDVATTVPEIGNSSALFAHVVTVDGGEVRSAARIRRVAVDMRTLRPVPIPDDLRAAFKRIAT